MKFKQLIAGAVLSLFMASTWADSHDDESVFQTWSVKAEVVKFNPMVLRINTGDKVSFENMTGHTASLMPEFVPAGSIDVVEWNVQMGNDFVTPPLTVPGIYFVKCDPHYGMGMVMAIIVSAPTNLTVIEAKKPKGVDKRLLKKVKKFLAAE